MIGWDRTRSAKVFRESIRKGGFYPLSARQHRAPQDNDEDDRSQSSPSTRPKYRARYIYSRNTALLPLCHRREQRPNLVFIPWLRISSFHISWIWTQVNPLYSVMRVSDVLVCIPSQRRIIFQKRYFQLPILHCSTSLSNGVVRLGFEALSGGYRADYRCHCDMPYGGFGTNSCLYHVIVFSNEHTREST